MGTKELDFEYEFMRFTGINEQANGFSCKTEAKNAAQVAFSREEGFEKSIECKVLIRRGKGKCFKAARAPKDQHPRGLAKLCPRRS